MLDNATLQKHYRRYQEQIVKDYFTFLQFPSISTDPEYKSQAIACAEWLREQMDKIGLKTEMWHTPSLPTIYASYLEAGPSKPTLLFYNHYDVQPVDPLEEWTTPPFEPTVRNGQVYARGAQDNKGQCWFILQALRLLRDQSSGHFPLNIKLCIEGEEESGSQGLSAILSQKAKQLRADYLIIGDSGIPNEKTPALTLGMRGIVSGNVEIRGGCTDMHSGFHGGIAVNPIHYLVNLLAKLHDTNGKVTIPGFYDDVVEMTPSERAQLSFAFDQEDYQRQFGIVPLAGERHLPPLDRAWLRPTVEINGISGGYAGQGFKTVIPAKALAKISCRLVPNQKPDKVIQQLKQFLEKNIAEGVQLHVDIQPGGEAVRANPKSPLVTAFSQAYTDFFQTPCQLILGGGSIPIASELARASRSTLLLFGLGLPTDKIHAPDEHFSLERLELGACIVARAIQRLAQENKTES